MPNTIPSTTKFTALREKEILAQSSILDYGLHFGSQNNQNSVKEIQSCAKLRPFLPSVKLFLNKSTGNLCIEDEALLEEIVAESWFITAHAEEEKVELIIVLAQKYKVPLYLCHIARKSEMDAIIRLRRELSQNKNTVSPIYAEVCPHHLAFVREDVQNNPLLCMKPALQSKTDREALWEGLHNSHINVIGSDHAPHTLAEKLYALQQNTHIYGVPGLESSLLFLLNEVHKGVLPLQKVVELGTAAAGIFGIQDKGRIAPGYDADLVLITLEESSILTHDSSFSKAGWTLFDGEELHAKIAATLSCGQIVYLANGMEDKLQHYTLSLTLAANARGRVFLNQGKELKCHAH